MRPPKCRAAGKRGEGTRGGPPHAADEWGESVGDSVGSVRDSSGECEEGVISLLRAAASDAWFLIRSAQCGTRATLDIPRRRQCLRCTLPASLWVPGARRWVLDGALG